MPAVVQIKGDGSAASVASWAQTFTTNVTAGNLIMAAFCISGAAGTCAVTDNQGNTYTDRSTGAGRRTFCFSAIASSSGSLTVTVTPPSNRWVTLGLIEASFTGALTFATATVVQASSTAPLSGNVSPAVAALLVGFNLFQGTTSCTEDGAWTLVCEETNFVTEQCGSVIYRSVSAGTYAASWTLGSSFLWQAGIVSVVEAAIDRRRRLLLGA